MYQRVALTSMIAIAFSIWSGGVAHATTYAFTFPGPPGGAFTGPSASNDQGDIVGYFTDADGFHGYLLEASGTFTQLDVDTPGATNTQAFGLNNNLQVVGAFQDPGGTHGFFWNSAFMALDVLDATSTVASDINDSGVIVGWFSDVGGVHGFVRDPGGSTAIVDAPGATFTQVLRIDNDGVISGVSNSPQGSAFDGSPIPEPGTMLLFGSGLAGMAALRRCRRKAGPSPSMGDL